jgi:hypothetical protein
MKRPFGDTHAVEFLERRAPHLKVEVYHIADSTIPAAVISAPEHLDVTDLPAFVVFAVGEQFDPESDTVRLFRQNRDGPGCEPTPYELKPGMNIRAMLARDLRRGVVLPRLYYEIIKGISEEQLKAIVIRTCDVYDAPCHRIQQVRRAMLATAPLSDLMEYIRKNVCPSEHVRMLLEVGGTVQPLDMTGMVDETALLRFEVVPPDQRELGANEFLVVALLSKFTKHDHTTVSLGSTFLFKVITGELVDAAIERLRSYECTDQRLLSLLVFQVGPRILNGDECLSAFVQPYDLVKVVQPSGARTRCMLKG